MPTTEISITIERPLEEVFAYAIAVDRLHEWNAVILDGWMTSGSESEVGATYTVKARVMGQTMEIPSKVVAYRENQRFAYEAFGSLPYVSTKIFEPTATGTRLTERLVMERQALLGRLLSPLLLRVSRRSHLKSLRLLKRRLEGSHVAMAA